MTATEPHSASGTPLSGWSIDSIIDTQAVRSVFQPVVHLTSGSIVGFEALSRGPAGTVFESPEGLILAATRAGRLGDLDWLCRTQAVRAIADAGLPHTLSWFINVEPAGLAVPCPAHLAAAQEQARAGLRVILEIVERDVDGNVLELIRATDNARRGSWGVALDDVGAREASLALLPLLRPDVVKLDMSLVHEMPRERAATITGAVRAYAERCGAVILAEGIETRRHEQLAKVFGATYAQGYYYGRPGPLPASVPAPAEPIRLGQQVAPVDGRTPFEVLATTIAPQRAEKQYLNHISAHLENEAHREPHASILLTGFQSHVFFSPSKRARYRRLATSNALTIVLADGLTPYDRPKYHVGPLAQGSRLRQEWLVIVLTPKLAGALIARECADSPIGPDGQRQFDFIYTHDRDAVVDAARSFVQDVPTTSHQPTTALAVLPPARTTRLGEVHTQPINEAGSTTGGPVALRPTQNVLKLSPLMGLPATDGYGFRATAQVVLDFLKATMPMSLWSITRVENERQSHLYINTNDYGLSKGSGHPWQDSYCIHMAAGTAPRLAPDSAEIPLYADAAVNQSIQIGAYAGAPITEPDGTLFGAICGLDRVPREDLAHFGPILNLLSELLTISLATDRALHSARAETRAALTHGKTDSLTGIRNRRAWDARIIELEGDYDTYADPTIILIIDLDDLKHVNDGPAGHSGGDQLLRETAIVMQRSIREHDFLARLGGDEFGIILTSTPATLAPAFAQRLSRALERAGISASVGFAPLDPNGTVRKTIKLADQAMYAAKRSRKGKHLAVTSR